MQTGFVVLSVCLASAAWADSARAKSTRTTSKQAQKTSATTNSIDPAQAAAIVVEVLGKPEFTQKSKTAELKSGQLLLEGDVVKCPAGAKAIFVYSDAREMLVAAGKSATVTAKTQKRDRDSADRWRKLVGLLTPTVQKERYVIPAAPAVRGLPASVLANVTPLDPVQPREFYDDSGNRLTGRVQASAPMFVFTPHRQSTTYRLRIERLGEVIVDRTLGANELVSDPANAVVIARPQIVLPATTLRWQVLAGNAVAAQTTRQAFRAVDVSEEPLRTALSALPTGVDAASQLLRGALFETEGFYADAISAYLAAIGKAPADPLYRRMLARLYDRLEVYTLADYEVAQAQAARALRDGENK